MLVTFVLPFKISCGIGHVVFSVDYTSIYVYICLEEVLSTHEIVKL
jgi:hypothetical protein